MDTQRVCRACMLGGNCQQAGTSVYNVESIDSYAPSIAQRPLPTVVRFKVPLFASGSLAADDAARSAQALVLKALFDDPDRPRERFVIVGVTKLVFQPAENSTTESSSTATLFAGEVTPHLVLDGDDGGDADASGDAAKAAEQVVYVVVIDVTPPALTGEPTALEVAEDAVAWLSMTSNQLHATSMAAGNAQIDASYNRRAVTSFENCLANTCLAGDQCIEGHSGPLCTVCLPGYGKTSVFKCARCNDPALAYLILVAGVLAAIAGCAILAWKQIVDGRESMNELPAPAVPLLFKIAMSGLQVMAIAARYDLRWPGFLGNVFDGADSAAGVGTAIVSLDCFLGDNPAVKPFWVTSIGIMVLPLFGVLLPVLFFTPRYYVAKRRYKAAVLAECAEQRRLLVETITECEAFRRNRDRTVQGKNRRERRQREDEALKTVVWERVEDSNELGVLALDVDVRASVQEAAVHADINLDTKDNAQADVEFAKKMYAKRRTHLRKSAAAGRNASTPRSSVKGSFDSNSGAPLAPPVRPPVPDEPSVSRSRLNSISGIPPLPVRMLSGSNASGDSASNPFGPAAFRTSPSVSTAPSPVLSNALSGPRTSALASVMSRHRLATRPAVNAVSAPDSTPEPSVVYSYGERETFMSTLRLDDAVPRIDAVDYEDALDLNRRSTATMVTFEHDAGLDSDSSDVDIMHVRFDHNAVTEAAINSDAGAVSSGPSENSTKSQVGSAAPTPASADETETSSLSPPSPRKGTAGHTADSYIDGVTVDEPLVSARMTAAAAAAARDSVFTFQRELLEDSIISEAALAHAFAMTLESHEAIFTRVAREVELYVTITKATPTFDAHASAVSAGNAERTDELARVVQSEDDLENMRVLAAQSFEVMYEAELLRERVLRRERALQRVRTEKQYEWYLETYGLQIGKKMFEAEQRKRRNAEPPKLTASEMRVRLGVAETGYEQVGSEYMGYVITTITVIMFMIHPNIVRQFFMVLSCKNIGGTDDPSASVVLGDMLEPCFSSQHLFFIFVLGIPMLVFWVLGIPLFAWFVLFRNRSLIMLPTTGVSTVMRTRKRVFESQMAFLYRGYKSTRYYWFLAEMARKAALVAISVFFPGALHTQLLMASLLIFVCILAQVAARPFENKIPEFAEFFSLFTSFMVFFLANFLFVETIDDASKVVVTLFICILIIVFCVVVVASFVLLTREEAKLGSLRTALREAHAQGMDTAPVIRDWRIREANERRRRRELKGGAAAKSGTAEDKKNDAATGAAALFTLKGGRTSGAGTKGFHTIRTEATASLGLSIATTSAGNADAIVPLSDAQRSVVLAQEVNAGSDVRAGLDIAVPAAADSDAAGAADASSIIIREANAAAAARRRTGAEALRLNLGASRKAALSPRSVLNFDE